MLLKAAESRNPDSWYNGITVQKDFSLKEVMRQGSSFWLTQQLSFNEGIEKFYFLLYLAFLLRHLSTLSVG